MSKAKHVSPESQGIYVISPSGAVLDTLAAQRGRERLESMGFKVSLDPAALSVHQRFAGKDAQRLSGFSRAIKQKHPIIMASRGGYGVTRLLPHMDWEAIAQSGKRFIGQSDFTAFNLALLAKTGMVSYAGPTLGYDFGARKPDELTLDIFAEVMRGELEILSFESADADTVDCRGVLWGGNLAMVTALIGTPYLPKIKGGILFLEDVGEHPYRIERMLIQLAQAGILQRQKALLLGKFTEYKLGPHDAGYDLPAVIQFIRKEYGIPVLTGLPYGHVPTKVTLPIGARVGLAYEDGIVYLVIDEHHH